MENYPEEVFSTYARINEQVWKELEKGYLDREDLKIKRFKLLLDYLELKDDPGKIASLYLDRLSSKDYLLPHALEVLEYLSKRASLALVTNGLARVQRGRIAKAGIEIFFQHIIISEEIGISKPDPDIFLFAMKLLHLPQHEILCVGDSPSSDIRGGNQAGVDTCWFIYPLREYPLMEPEPTYMISDLRELLTFAPELS